MSEAERWDERYREAPLSWPAEPNEFVEEELAGLEPGTAVDLACGEGRNAVWLAERGWQVTGVDFSSVAIDRARRMTAERGF
ncbi:MAG TPA: class I SAM-dependent methyltransferase, partial [Acidimicrobiia bacterium]|nr:class I SAM-dependent methyltransferase [Acidimicrobiia bacterium]